MIIVYILIAINIYFYIQTANGKINYENYSMSYYSVSVCKEKRRLLSSMFIHGNLLHLILNMLSLLSVFRGLYSFGLNPITITILYFLTGILGGYFALIMYHNQNQDNVNVIGASGAICGLFGFYMILLFMIFGGQMVRSILSSLGNILIISILPGISAKGHISCLSVGLILGFIIFKFLPFIL